MSADASPDPVPELTFLPSDRTDKVPVEAPTTPDYSEFIEAVKAQARRIDAPGHEDHGRYVVHSQAGSFGADWYLEGVLEAIEESPLVCWDTVGLTAVLTGHHLLVGFPDGSIRHFDVKPPEGANGPWRLDT